MVDPGVQQQNIVKTFGFYLFSSEKLVLLRLFPLPLYIRRHLEIFEKKVSQGQKNQNGGSFSLIRFCMLR